MFFQKYHRLSQCCLIKFHSLQSLQLFDGFHVHSFWCTRLLSWLSSPSNWLGEFLLPRPLHWSHVGEPLGHVCEKCILPWHNLTSSYTLWHPEANPVRLVGQSLLHNPPITCLCPRLYVALLADTLLDFDAGSLLTLKGDSETVFENCYSPVPHSIIGTACHQVSP